MQETECEMRYYFSHLLGLFLEGDDEEYLLLKM